MADADAPLSTSMLSMSLGFMSAARLTTLSCTEYRAVRVPAPLTTLAPPATELLASTTPSTTYSGSELPMSDETPRMRICAPPPGAPELVEMLAPAILPWSAFSTVCAGARCSSCAETTATALAAFWRRTEVVCPVTTSPSRLRMSWSSATLTAVCPAGTTTWRLV
jgi:hypothetical protein